jgi:small subunit ribosomal protein S23
MIFRLNGLVKSGLIPWNERPLWYDVYKTFPPDRDPSYRSVLGHDEIPQLPPKLFYPEDELRAYLFIFYFHSFFFLN